MELDLTPITRKAARDRWNALATEWNLRLEAGLFEDEPRPMWKDLPQHVRHVMLENELEHMKYGMSHIIEGVLTPIRAKIEANELVDPETDAFVAPGYVGTDDLREVIGETR